MIQPLDMTHLDPRPEQLPSAERLLASAHALLERLGSRLSRQAPASGIAPQDLALCRQALSSAVLAVAEKDVHGEALPTDLRSDLASAINTLSENDPDSAALIDDLLVLLPVARWYSRQAQNGQDPHFVSRHRNSLLIGPGAPIDCETMMLGVSLLKPDVTYPFHQHPPNEFYLVLSEGEWFREDAGWWTPGINGVVFNPGNARHAMKSFDKPLLALWGLI